MRSAYHIETSENNYQVTWLYIPEEQRPQQHSCKSWKTRWLFQFYV